MSFITFGCGCGYHKSHQGYFRHFGVLNRVNLRAGIYLSSSSALGDHPTLKVRTSAMKKTTNWNWASACVGAASVIAATALINAKPKDPTFHLISISLTSFKLNFPVIDAEVVLTVHVTNPNIVPIEYSSTTMSIFYDGSLLGSAVVQAGSQNSRSCQLLKLPARLDGLELAHHASRFLADVTKREMVVEAKVEIQGKAKMMWWDHGFKVHVDSQITVDPVFLDVIDQENKSELELLIQG